MKKDVSQNRLHHELQLPSLGGCSSTSSICLCILHKSCVVDLSISLFGRYQDSQRQEVGVGLLAPATVSTSTGMCQGQVHSGECWFLSSEILLKDRLLIWPQGATHQNGRKHGSKLSMGVVISIPGNTQNLTGHHPQQYSVVEPSLSWGVNYTISRNPFQPHPFHDAMTYVSLHSPYSRWINSPASL